MAKALSSKAGRSAVANGCAAMMMAVFVLGGLTGTAFTLVIPAMRMVASRDWPTVPCAIVTSAVGSHSGGKGGTTYSIDITFRYRVGGREYTSDRYAFVGGSSSGRAGKEVVVDRFPPGSTAVCYVDPGDPGLAVLDRGLVPELWLGLVPLGFAVFGGLVMWGVLRATKPAAVPTLALAAADADGGVALKPALSPWGKVLGLGFITAFWNGIVALFLVGEVVPSWQRGEPNWILTIFLTPFVVVGLALLVGLAKAVLQALNPRVRLRLTRPGLRPGDRAKVTWDWSGNVHAVTRLRLVLEGRELATYRAGRNSRTATSVFLRQLVAEIGDGPELANGRATLAIPADAMHTFNGESNKIAWVLKAHGEIRHWPDVQDDFALIVAPATQPGQEIADQTSSPV